MTEHVLITGADGFIGSHLAELLVERGYRVRALSQYNSFNNWGWLEGTKCLSEIEVVCGDVRDANFCREATKDIDIVFHLAALIAIPYSYSAPASYVDTNVMGTLNICQASLDSGVTRVIHTSTSEVYGTAQYVPIDEQHPLQAQSPYSASKIGADAVAFSYASSFELPLTIARPFNTYGPRQSARAVIPTIISQLAANEEVLSLGDLAPTRDFNFVGDTCTSFLALAQCEQSVGEIVNLGSGGEISIGDCAELIKRIMASPTRIERDEQRIRPEHSEVFRLLCDNSKFNSLIPDFERTTLEDGLRETVEWFTDAENLAQYKTNIYNV